MAKARRRNLVIGQSGGATAVINASLAGAFSAAQESQQFDEIYGMHYAIEGFLKEDLLDLRQQPADLWPRLRMTPASALGSCRYKLKDDDAPRLFALFERYAIHDMLYMGGNDSADTAHRLMQMAQQRGYELRVISVPKTIDNDLPATDHCPGYGTAARFYAQATMNATMNMLALPQEYPVKIVETMGRDAGWLVAASALGKHKEDDAPHLLLCPELAFREDSFLARVEAIYQRLGYVVVVASTALHDAQGQPIGVVKSPDPFGHQMASGATDYLADLVRSKLHLRTRVDRFGDLQWCEISRSDNAEAYLVGQSAVHLLCADQSDCMVTLIREEGPTYHCTTGSVALSSVADQQRTLPAEFFDAERAMITTRFSDYALPLLGDPLPVYPQLVLKRPIL